MCAESLSVEVDVGTIVGRAEPQERTRASFQWQTFECFPVPDGPFIIEQVRALSVPITRYLQRRRLIEVVLDAIATVGWFAVEVKGFGGIRRATLVALAIA